MGRRSTTATENPVSLSVQDILGEAAKRGSRVATLQSLGDRSIWWLPTGNTALDRLFGDGNHHGIGSGLVYLIWGLSNTGKSLTCLSAAKYVIDAGGIAVYVDMERCLGTSLTNKLGIDPERMVVFPNEEILDELRKKNEAFTLEAAFEEIDRFVRNIREIEKENGVSRENRRPIVVFYDSVASSITKMRDEADYGDSRPGNIARAISEGLQQIRPIFTDHDATMVLVNQERTNIRAGLFGDSRSQPGGLAMHFYADVEVYLRYAGQVKDGEHKVGELVQAIIERSRLRPGPNKAKFRILYDRGIDDVYGVIATLIDLKVIEQSGSWYTFTPIGRVQGEQALYNALYENPEVYLAARNLVLEWKPELTGNLKIAEPEK